MHLARILPILDFNGRFLKIYKISYNFDHSGPNKPKFGLDSLWGSLKKIIYQIFDILIFRDFLGSEKCRIGKKWRFSDFQSQKNREKLKNQKFGRPFSLNYPKE